MKYINDNKLNSYSNFKIIIADTELNTFNEIAKINNDFCFINLSSDFAVNFVLEYEKIDFLLISNRIKNLDKLIVKADKKKIKIFIFGKDIEYPLSSNHIKDFLIKEIENSNKYKRPPNHINMFKNFFIYNSKKWHPDIISNKTKIEKAKKPLKEKTNNNCALSLDTFSAEATVNTEKEKTHNDNFFPEAISSKAVDNLISNILKPEIINLENKSSPNDIANPVIMPGKHTNNNFKQFVHSNKSVKIEYQIRK
jgi:hypothetical protein